MNEIIIAVVSLVGVGILGGGAAVFVRGKRGRDEDEENARSSAGNVIVDEPSDSARATPGRTRARRAPVPVDEFGMERTQESLETDRPESPATRMARLRDRLSRSNSNLGQTLLQLLSRDRIDESVWDEIEETLLLADVGPSATDKLLDALRRRVRVEGSSGTERAREMLREELLTIIDPTLDRSLATTPRTSPNGELIPAVVMVVGVNGTGKTTTIGKLARVLVAEDKDVILGAADTFRAAAADQLQTWGARVGVPTVRSDREGADPASVAYDAVRAGVVDGVDVVLVDTAGRLQNKVGLMDELSKVRRVAERALGGGEMSEILLVLDATTGQNGMKQAKIFSDVVDISGIVLTKLDGTAKGGIVVAVQQELGVPVKLIGLGEGADDLAPFDAEQFVDALIS